MATLRALGIPSTGGIQRLNAADILTASNIASDTATSLVLNSTATPVTLQVAGTTKLDISSTAVTVRNSAVFTGDGSGLTTLNGANISAGTIATASLDTATQNRLNPAPSAAGRTLYDTGSAWAALAAGAANTILQSNGAAAPSWTSAPTVSGANITSSTLPGAALTAASVAVSKLTGGTANRIVYDNGTGASWTTAPASSTSFLRGSNPPAFDLVNLNTDTAGIVPTAKGGTNMSSFTAGGILYASDSSSLSFVGPGTSGFVVTSNGTVPTMAAPITNTTGSSSLGSTYNVTSSYANAGLSVSLPNAGKYRVFGAVRCQLQVSSGTGNITLRLYNSTAASAITDSERISGYSASSVVSSSTVPISEFITVAGATTIDVQAIAPAGPTYTSAQIISDSSGRSRLHYEKVGP